MTVEAAGLVARLLQAPGRPPRRSAACWTLAERGRASAERRDAMFARRADQHHRGPGRAPHRLARAARRVLDGRRRDVVPEVHEVLDRMAASPTGSASGSGSGHTGRPIRNVVNIGIGGSDLGPAMAYEALRAFADRGADVPLRLQRRRRPTSRRRPGDLDPAETLFVVSSKTFTTLETMTNAHDGPRPGCCRPARRRRGRRPALRGRVHQRRQGGRVRHRPGQHVRVLGLGRRPVLARLGHRAVADDRHRPGRASASCWPASARWTSTSATAPLEREPAGAARPARASGTTTSSARRRHAVLPYASTWPGSPPTCSSSTWSPTASGCAGTARRSTYADRPGRVGRRRAPTASTPTTSCSTRAPRWSRPTSSASCRPAARPWATTTTC